MKFKFLAVATSLLALAACGNGTQDPAKLKGENFVTKSGDMEITLSFAPEDMRVNGRALNLYNASYTASGDTIQFGEMLSTMMAGPESEMQAEQEYFQFMSTVETYTLSEDTLVLKNSQGEEMVFQKAESITNTVPVTETDDTATDATADTSNDGAVTAEATENAPNKAEQK